MIERHKIQDRSYLYKIDWISKRLKFQNVLDNEMKT